MAKDSHRMHRRRIGTAASLLAVFLALPALAAPPHIICSESEAADLHVSVEALSAESVAHDAAAPALSSADDKADDHALLAPLAREAIRHVFNDSLVSDDDEETLDDDSIETPRAMTTRLPGVSEERLQRYKKQMFRRDI